MKIEKLTDNKIRIILNLDDLKEKNIDLHSLLSNSVESHRLFVDMLDEAEKAVGFSAKDSKVRIDAVASTEGNFIFTITKMEEKPHSKKHLKIKRKQENKNSRKAIYQFETFEEFCNYSTYIENSNLHGLDGMAKNFGLYSYNDAYYLIISDINPHYFNLTAFYASITEFAKYVNHPETFERKLLEYGKPIMKRNAIKRCVKYFG